MKFLYLLSLTSLSFAQTVITVPFQLPNSAIVDALTWTRTQVSSPSPAATLTADITSGATTFAISSATGYTATDTFLNAGATLLIDSEEITCTTFNSGTATYSGCTRGQQTTVAAAHSSGAPVQQLKYATNSSLLKALVIPGLQAAINSLGTASVYRGSLITAVSTAQTNLTNADSAGTLVK